MGYLRYAAQCVADPPTLHKFDDLLLRIEERERAIMGEGSLAD